MELRNTNTWMVGYMYQFELAKRAAGYRPASRPRRIRGFKDRYGGGAGLFSRASRVFMAQAMGDHVGSYERGTCFRIQFIGYIFQLKGHPSENGPH